MEEDENKDFQKKKEKKEQPCSPCFPGERENPTMSKITALQTSFVKER